MKDLSTPVGKHFTWKEVIHTDRTQFLTENSAYAETEPIQTAVDALAPILDAFRDQWGPVKIDSWVRCPGLNDAVGGQPSSQHMKGEAADTVPLGCADPSGLVKVFNWLRRESGLFIPGSPDSKLGQVIIEGRPRKVNAPKWTWIHISLGAGFRAPERCGEAYYTTSKYNPAKQKMELSYHPVSVNQEPPL